MDKPGVPKWWIGLDTLALIMSCLPKRSEAEDSSIDEETRDRDSLAWFKSFVANPEINELRKRARIEWLLPLLNNSLATEALNKSVIKK